LPNEWAEARKHFLVKEREFTRLGDELSRERRELLWERVDKTYVFERSNGKVKLADLFDGRSPRRRWIGLHEVMGLPSR
jgi:predicted dithiol-disulfide oxidoreductase (DUF899 family)